MCRGTTDNTGGMTMFRCPNIVKIEYSGDKHKTGSAFILPTLKTDYMYLITAYHIFEGSSEINTKLISLVDQGKNKLLLSFAPDYFIEKELDICIFKILYSNTFSCPIISSPYDNEKVIMFGFPVVLSNATREYHILNCSIDEVSTDYIIAAIEDDISNYMNDDHEMIEGFSGCPFMRHKDNNVYFLGIENKTETKDASYRLVRGVSGISIAKMIYDYFYKDTSINQSELFNIQDKNDHYILTSEEDCIVAFRKALFVSKNSILRLDDTIGNGYEIDRSDIINRINSCNSQFISIYGEAGSGKSALAKKVVRNKNYVLFARAEQFVSAGTLCDIWDLDINDLLNQISISKIYIVIDALEFIADKSQRYDLLLQLYDIASNHNNIIVITTCRSSDRSAFLKIESNYSIQCFEVGPITPKELDEISLEFEAVSIMRETGQYSQLLQFPFYINMIISNNIKIDDIKGQNSFRKLIYSVVICLKNKYEKYNIAYEDVIIAVHEITFRRAKEFLLGIHKENLKSNVVKALVSEGVIIEKDDYIRLRYDIYEDIVFEQEFDKQFVNCKGNYNAFYDAISAFGRCVYRRYQIWIANKLFIKESRDRFIYQLLFSDNTIEVWNKQTMIGIVKSDYCIDFFVDYKDKLLDSTMLQSLIDIINLYAFTPKIISSKSLKLLPIGKARGQVLCIIEQNSYELIDKLNEPSIIKLCSDYSFYSSSDKNESNAVCHIIETILEKRKSKKGYYYSADTLVCPLLSILYRLANECTAWIKLFLDTIIAMYRSYNKEQKHFAESIIRFTIKNTTDNLALSNYEELIKIATVYWCEEDTEDLYYDSHFDDSKEYGLNKNAGHYNHEFMSAEENTLITNMIRVRPNDAIEWIIGLINKAMDNYFKNNQLNDCKVSLFFVNENVIREYYASNQLWLMGIRDCCGHELLSDMVYLLKRIVIRSLEEIYKENNTLFKQLANHIKSLLYTKSNNIALLTIIEEIGLHFKNELPGYALDLASSIEIVLYDIRRYTLYIHDDTRDILKEQVFISIGMPSSLIKERYQLDDSCNITLQQYVLHSFILFEELREQCNGICDYLYDKYPNTKDTSYENFQIQKMDGRSITINRLDDTHVAVETAITGEAENVIKNQEKEAYEHELKILLEKCNYTDKSGPNYVNINKTINYIIKLSNEREDVKLRLERLLIVLFCIVLKNEATSNDRRNYLCNIWLDKLEKVFYGQHPLIEIATIKILLEQVNSSVSDDIKNRIKTFILKCIRYNGDDGIVDKYVQHTVQFLNTDDNLAHSFFYTILMLSKRKHHLNEDEIVRQFLNNKKALRSKRLSAKQIHLKELIAITNCGVSLEDDDFCNAFILMIQMINVDLRKTISTLDVHDIYKIVCYIQQQIKNRSLSNKVIDILFDNIDFENASDNIIDFYSDIFNYNLSTFFDGHSDRQIRLDVQNTLCYLEKKIKGINNSAVRVEMYKALLLSSSRYGCGDWSKIKTQYSYADKMFLNNQLNKFGEYHFEDALYSIYQLQYNELLPEIIVGISNALNKLSLTKEAFTSIMQRKRFIYLIEQFVLVAFLKFSDRIKGEEEYCNAFELILTILVSVGNEKAAIILDEFRIH